MGDNRKRAHLVTSRALGPTGAIGIQGGPKRMETFVSFAIGKPFMGFAYY